MSNFFTHKFRGKSPIKIAFMVLFGILAIVGFAALFGYIIMSLWNWLMPDIFGLTTLTYWQAVGVFALAKILFGGGGFGKENKSSKKSKCEHKRTHKNDFSKWKHYDEFWKTEGNQAYEVFVSQKEGIVESEKEGEE